MVPGRTFAGRISGSRRRSAAMADRDAHLTDPETATRPRSTGSCRRTTPPELAAAIDPARATRPPGRGCRAAAGRSGSASSTTTGNAVSLIESNYLGFGSGDRRPSTGIAYQNRGSFFSLDPDSSQRPRPGQADAPHAPAGDALPRRAAVGRDRLDGRRRPAADPRPGRVRPRRRGPSTWRPVVGMPRWFVEPAEHFAPPSWSAPSRASGPACSRGSRSWVTRSTADGAVRRTCSATATPSSSSTAGRPRSGPLAAATDPRSAGLPAAW